MRFFIYYMFFLSIIFANDIEITANSFEASEVEKKSIFKGNVEVKNEDSYIKADSLKLFFDDNRKPNRYEAVGNCEFKITTKDKKVYVGKSDKLVYLPTKKRYEFFGNSYLEELGSKKRIFAKYILFDETFGKAVVKGDENKPVKFIFNMDERK